MNLLMLIKIITLILVILNSNLFAAGPFSHIMFADLYLQAVYPNKYLLSSEDRKKNEYLMGALFPDIRYLGVIQREETHSQNNDYNNMSLNAGFLAGVHHHAFVDLQRERFAGVYGIYKYLDGIEQQDKAAFLKLVEDEIFFKNSNSKYRATYSISLSSIKHFKIYDQKIKEWYELMDQYLILGPSKFIEIMAGKNLNYFGISPKKLSLWSKKIKQYADNPKFIKYCDKLLSLFEENFIFIAEDQGKLFNEKKFRKWLKGFSKISVKAGIDDDIVQREFKNVLFNPSVLYKDRNQVSHAMSVDQDTIAQWMFIPEHGPTSTRVSVGKHMLNKYKDNVIDIENKLNVDKEIILAIWGTESKYGYVHYQYEALDAILTLAYDGRRTIFVKEAIALLRQISKGNIVRPQPSSWAGAIGQTQFLPSNISAYGMSYDSKENIDLMNSAPDVLSSIALYLSAHGYSKNIPIGQLISITNDKNIQFNKQMKLGEIKKYLKPNIGQWLIDDNELVKIIKLPNEHLPKLLVTKNYNILMKWNKSDLFGMQILYLANELMVYSRRYDSASAS